MTKSDQIKILNNKTRANNAQYNLDRQNAEISAYSNGDLDKYEYLTKQDLIYKPDALQQARFEYSPLSIFFYGKTNKQEDKTKRVGIFQGLKNIEVKDAEEENIGNIITKYADLKPRTEYTNKYKNKSLCRQL